jgi:hypothetical protein
MNRFATQLPSKAEVEQYPTDEKIINSVMKCFTNGKKLIRNSYSQFSNQNKPVNKKEFQKYLTFIHNKQRSMTELELFQSHIVSKRLGLATLLPLKRARRKTPIFWKPKDLDKKRRKGVPEELEVDEVTVNEFLSDNGKDIGYYETSDLEEKMKM